MIDEQLKLAVESRLIELKKEFSATKDHRRQRDAGLERMVRSYWDEPLLLLEMQIESASEAEETSISIFMVTAPALMVTRPKCL